MKEILQLLYVFGFTLTAVWCQHDPKTHVYCKDLNPQNSLDVDQVSSTSLFRPHDIKLLGGKNIKF
jgi:hypothetical protein